MNQLRETILVTGTSGLIGTAVCNRFARRFNVIGGDPEPPPTAECICVDSHRSPDRVLQATARAADHDKAAHDMMQMQHINTQAQAEALKPGDAVSMTCTKCKEVMVQKVTADKAHVKMMTVGEKTKCHGCGGTSEVVATGKGEGKNAEVKRVCSKCGEDAMFCSAVKPGSRGMKDMPMEKK